ncbi:MAG TPA: hypothetical protein VIL30_02875 [Ramlibacter sp.]|jgi:hypothetical protein
MSLFNWLSPRKKARPLPPESSGLSRLDSTKPFMAEREPAAAQPANRKQERMARRELLYGLVRDAMTRAGVLSASYKFKVLSLDARGRQFLVMVDLAQGAGGETNQLAEIEATIAQSAKQRHDILVSAVYWRSNDHVAVGDPVARPPQRARSSRPAPLQALQAVSAPAPLFEEPSQPAQLEVAPPRAHSGFDPLHPDEVAAFKRALAMGVSGRDAIATVPRAAQNHALLTGFEDTELAETAEDAERLSGTQYGELR